jgi:mutator protein MutT
MSDASRLRVVPVSSGRLSNACRASQLVTSVRKRIVVAAAVIRRGEEYFVTRRHAGVHLEGYWEFPGGKCDPGETLTDCLRREIREELDADVVVRDELLAVSHTYPDREVELRFFDCDLTGAPRPMLGQEMRWVRTEDLVMLPFPPADAELLELLRRRGTEG